ncbi:ABC transporter ATP-binding protein [Longimicrobium terrae]|uniref:ABC-2 type transport system ATP-binding protein n=1 Tax=Longimicrobium terrae TaxID=1639882 RepID=A0A841GVK6_9BACT|nr:ATP-binding cassette domain-containing protein [Longimicrobium terrae]MBB4635090.1 ABC-2 type transport system ATP-binding protein [Longimicrobium terrae]MBB6069484.1 ABC-2 type transport system ATP-binding protein [Longimicrobium terrae]NNC31713.1 ATP-binding cassette domain-containing protein [Longimicrobium terrae]
MSHALLLDGVSKSYAGHAAVRQLSLAVPRGTIYGILGPNGAGKSTTLRMVMNIIMRDSGTVSLLGSDPERDNSVLQRVGYLPEERGLYKKMTVLDVITFFAGLKGVPTARAKSEGGRWLERMGLADWRNARVETLSKGMQQKVQFITTVVHAPDLLILDEPHSGLDPVNQEVLRDTILQARDEGRTVIFSTHSMESAEQMCEHVCIIAGGQKVLDGNLREVRRGHRGNRYAIAFDEPSDAADRFMATWPGFDGVQKTREGWSAELRPGADPRALLAAANGLDVALSHFEHIQPTLHEIFVEKVGDAARPRRREEATHA